MGRSVSYPSGALVTFAQTPTNEDYCTACHCPESECECSEDDQQLQGGDVDWDYVHEDFVSQVKDLFPSAYDCEKWIGREDHAVAANTFCRFGYSEYRGLMSYWMIKRDDLEGYQEGLADRWVAQAWPKFEKTFGTLTKQGSMSNGTGVYVTIERVAA